MFRRYLITLVIFFVVDLIWLGRVAPKFYRSQIGHLMSDQVNWSAAIIFYLVYIMALLIFVINPALAMSDVMQAARYGALLGFAMYATYDLTNMATLRNWPLMVTVVDLAWGTLVTALTAVLASSAINYFNI